MKTLFRRFVSLLLCLSIVSSFTVSHATDFGDSGEVKSISTSSDGMILTIETTEDIIQVKTTETEDAYILRQYTNGVLVDEVFLEKGYLSPGIAMMRAGNRVYVGKANYRAGYYQMDYEYDISVSVYRTTTIERSEVYRPINGKLTIAQFVADAASALSIPIGLLNTAVGAIMGAVSFIGGKYISWEESKIPALSCTGYHYDYDLYHYGNAPIYETGECINRTGAKYVVESKNSQADYAGDIYYEGLLIESQHSQAADDLYHELYSFTPYKFVNWS